MGAVAVKPGDVIKAFRELEAVYSDLRTVSGSAKMRVLAKAMTGPDDVEKAIALVSDASTREIIRDSLLKFMGTFPR